MPLTILMTNIALVGRTGTEVVTEQLADGLRRRGHRPILFTPFAGPSAERMRQRGHIVVTRPDAAPFRPDIVHAHHTGPAMAALAAHPGVPALFVCHDATAPFDTPPPHPRVRRLFAVDERCRARLVADGVAADAIALLPNAIDLARIPPRASALPEQPRRALAMTKQAAHLPALRQACRDAGLVLDEFGPGAGRVTETPEAEFARADLVFATARMALEAAAAGAGVVVCDARGCAGFLTRERAETWLPWNLGAGLLKDPPDAAAISAAIADYSAHEAAAVTQLVRQRHDLEAMLDRLETVYADMLAEPRHDDVAAEAAATGAFIAGWVPHFDQHAPWRRMADGVAAPALPLHPEVEALVALMRGETATVQGRIDQLAARSAATEATLQTVGQALRGTPAALHVMRGDILALHEEIGRLAARRSPGERVWNGLAALWRRAVPTAIRAPLHRLRRRMTASDGS